MLRAEGIEFVTNADIGKIIDVNELKEVSALQREDASSASYAPNSNIFLLPCVVQNHDALALCLGSTKPRDLPIVGRGLNGVHFAMEFLTKNQKRLLVSKEGNLESKYSDFVSAAGKDVIVIGGGDTGTDCIGTSMRHRCKSIVNFELMPKPPPKRDANNPWPEWPRTYGVDYGHAEVQAVFGKDPREYSVITKEFVGDDDNNLTHVVTEEVTIGEDGKIQPVEGTTKEWPCQLAILSMGFVSPEHYIAAELGLDIDQRDNIHAVHGDYRTNVEGVFAAGDCRRGQSLVVWAINEGRGIAESIDAHLKQKAGEVAA